MTVLERRGAVHTGGVRFAIYCAFGVPPDAFPEPYRTISHCNGCVGGGVPPLAFQSWIRFRATYTAASAILTSQDVIRM